MQKIIIVSCSLLLLTGFMSFGQSTKSQSVQVTTSRAVQNNSVESNFGEDEDFIESDDNNDSSSVFRLIPNSSCCGMDDDSEEKPFVLMYNVPIEVAPGIIIDSVWLTVRPYYSTWSSTKVNPYELDGAKFVDTLDIQLIFEDKDLNWSMPLHKHEVTSEFGLRRWKWHYGDDLRLNVGDTVKVAFDGVVRMARFDKYGYGNYVLVRHYNGLETLYGHLKSSTVSVGDVVRAGEMVGYGGSTGRSTGPHLHFETRYQGNAIDPKMIFDYLNDTLKSPILKVEPETFSYLKQARAIRFHKVRSGDTLSHISARYGISVSKICGLNGISKKSTLRIGQKLRIT